MESPHSTWRCSRKILPIREFSAHDSLPIRLLMNRHSRFYTCSGLCDRRVETDFQLVTQDG